MAESRFGDSPLGAVADRDGVAFRLAAADATAVEVCLYSAADPTTELDQLSLERDSAGVWRGRATGEGPGLLYGFRVDGPRDPATGHLFDPSKLLIDPRAGAVAGDLVWNRALLSDNSLDSADFVPRSVVIDPRFDWDGDIRPEIPWERTSIYECHVRGMTRRHPGVPAALRGTYLGLAQAPVIDHLLSLGATAVELLPVAHFLAERHLAESGRPNYWGYSPIGFLAPYSGYATGALGQQVGEFKTMVRELHRAGIEVILDLVLNHTAESGIDGATLGPRGYDNARFYRHEPTDPSRYIDFTGCGNTIDVRSASARGLLLDSLRYWATEMRVDGFRLDLAAVLGRGDGGFSAQAPFFREVARDPVLSRRKLIAEPWDLGPKGYQAGRFPDGWREWNDRYRDALRSFWRGDPGAGSRLATRLSGSSDLYARRPGGPLTGINYVACHDGFTLHDLVSYRRKHNWLNGERSRDGRSENLSRNWGVEGPTQNRRIRRLRQRAKKNLLASLALSAGVPMLAHGDELGRTQEGNNNAYCHDSELTWVDWDLDDERRDLLDFTREVFRLRRELPFLARPDFFSSGELSWLAPDGRQLSGDEWHEDGLRALMMLHRPAGGPALAIALNAGSDEAAIDLPPPGQGFAWRRRLTTANDARIIEDRLRSPAYSLSVLVAAESPAADPSNPPDSPSA